jgi:hypothetical protein
MLVRKKAAPLRTRGGHSLAVSRMPDATTPTTNWRQRATKTLRSQQACMTSCQAVERMQWCQYAVGGSAEAWCSLRRPEKRRTWKGPWVRTPEKRQEDLDDTKADTVMAALRLCIWEPQFDSACPQQQRVRRFFSLCYFWATAAAAAAGREMKTRKPCTQFACGVFAARRAQLNGFGRDPRTRTLEDVHMHVFYMCVWWMYARVRPRRRHRSSSVPW